MQAAVYRGVNDVRLETVPVPEIGRRRDARPRPFLRGLRHRSQEDLHRIPFRPPHLRSRNLWRGRRCREGASRLTAPETASWSSTTSLAANVSTAGTRPLPSAPPTRKWVCTAGFEPSGGGFAEYVRVMDWIVEHGTVRIPDGISFEQACFVEPVNTCMKGIEALRLRPGETVLAIGQGPIGIILSVLARRAGATLITSDLYPERLRIGSSFGLDLTIDASRANVVERVRELTEGRGADAVILAVGGNALIRTAMDAARPGGRVLLFAQTQHGEAVIDPAAICVDEKTLVGSYSASVDLQEESVRFVMNREMDLERLVSHRFPLLQSPQALDWPLTLNPRR